MITATTVNAIGGFRLVYDRTGTGPPVVALHGWPGDRHDFDSVIDRLRGVTTVIAPDLRGFGDSDKHTDVGYEAYSPDGQAASVLGLIDELELESVVLIGYDIGSRVAQALARRRPELVAGLVLSPPLPGVGDRIFEPRYQSEYWYQAFHQLQLIEEIIDGSFDAVRSYVSYFWNHWSAPNYRPDPGRLDRLAARYSKPGALAASIAYYRAGAGAVHQALVELTPLQDNRIEIPTVVVWPGSDALIDPQWTDRLSDYFVEVSVDFVPESGHFVPVEAPDAVAGAVRSLLCESLLNSQTGR